MIRECIKSSHHDVEVISVNFNFWIIKIFIIIQYSILNLQLIQRVLLNIIEALNIKLDEI